jgi:hypothetical protein
LGKEKRKGFSLIFSVSAQLSPQPAAHRFGLPLPRDPSLFLPPLPAWAEPSEPPLEILNIEPAVQGVSPNCVFFFVKRILIAVTSEICFHLFTVLPLG